MTYRLQASQHNNHHVQTLPCLRWQFVKLCQSATYFVQFVQFPLQGSALPGKRLFALIWGESFKGGFALVELPTVIDSKSDFHEGPFGGRQLVEKPINHRDKLKPPIAPLDVERANNREGRTKAGPKNATQEICHLGA